MAYNTLLVSQMHTTIKKPSDIDTNAQLHRRACAGDEDAKRALIENNMPLVVSKVDSLLRKIPHLGHLRDDLTGEGFLGLTKAVDTLCKRPKVTKPSGYLRKSILNAFADLIEAEVPPCYSRRTYGRALETGRRLPEQDTLSEWPEFGRCNHCIDQIDMEDLLFSCCLNNHERRYVELRQQGFTRDETIQELGIPRRTFFRTINQLQARIQTKLNQLR